MELITNNTTKNHLDTITESLDGTTELICCIAFLKESGLDPLLNQVKTRKIKSTFYIGLDFYLTEPSALRKIYQSECSLYLTQIEKKTYHPKIYYFKKEGIGQSIIGSANLTNGGMNSNIESSVLLDFKLGSTFDTQLNAQIEHLKEISTLVDNCDPIDEYEELYKIFHLTQEESNSKFLKEEKKVKQKRKPKTNSKKRPTLTNEYLNQWPEKFEEFKIYKKKNNGNPIVSKHDKLHKWYQKQNDLYNYIDEDGKRLIPNEHLELLNSEGFYWGNGNDLRSIRTWEENLGKCMEYSFLKKQPYVWVTWEKKDPKFKYKKYAHWCVRQRRRIKGEDNPPISEYELKRLRDVNFLFEDNESRNKVKEDEFLENLLKLEDFINLKRKNGDKKWLPSQTESDTSAYELGNWLNDSLEWIKRQLDKDPNDEIALSREKEFLQLGIYKEGIFKSYFEASAKAYVEMRKLYPIDNPKGEERKPYQEVLKWATENKSRYDTFPEWRKERLEQIGLKK